jgi:hypothetical protein
MGASGANSRRPQLAENTHAIEHHLNLAAMRAIEIALDEIERCPEANPGDLLSDVNEIVRRFLRIGVDQVSAKDDLDFCAAQLLRLSVWLRRSE